MKQLHIRNFVIISHIDHGKSTLADRFLETTETVEKRKMQPQYLDSMSLEREKGITIKMQPVRMLYSLGSTSFILNLIDTPGHVDFYYEVSRSLAAVEGAILLVDATKGIQAQTIANLDLALNENLTIIPAINKVDIASPEQIASTRTELAILLNIGEGEIHLISAKSGKNIRELLTAVIKKVPAPLKENKPLRALIFDSEYDFYKGTIVYIRVIDGEIKKRDRLYLMKSKTQIEALEVGYFNPKPHSSDVLEAGNIGYIATGLKNIEKCRVGDTITTLKIKDSKLEVEPLKGYKEPQAMIFATFFPIDPNDYDKLRDGLKKLKLNDASLVFEPESSEGLGRGFRCGFLGMLHLEIVSERLKRDYELDLIVTSPAVIYKIIDNKNSIKFIHTADEFPEANKIQEAQEPWVKLEIISLSHYLGAIMKLSQTIRGIYKNTKYVGQNKLIIEFEAPLSEIIGGFYDKLKSVTSGYGSMSYQLMGYQKASLVKLDILLAGEKINAFSKIVIKEREYKEAKKMTNFLKETIPAQQFATSIQAVVGGKIISRETRKAFRKDVTAGLYGGDVTRKRKLLEKQKKGKKKLAKFGKINLPAEIFLKILKEK